MQTRRDFFSRSLAWITRLIALSAAAAPSAVDAGISHVPLAGRKTTKRLFRRKEDKSWGEIAWDDARPGDHVICIGIFDGVLNDLETFVVETQADPNDPDGAMKIDHLVKLIDLRFSPS